MHDPNTCNCCSGIAEKTPLEVYNRPGLNAVSYRIGTHQQFKQSLLAKLSTGRKEALQALTTRSDNDFSIALLDAWAMVSDVLTFYQERIANESYLRTATEQFSITELARLIGYQLRPGVAASTYLAFTIEEPVLAIGQALIPGLAAADSEPPTIQIAEGTKVQSIPGQDEEPQIYETIESISTKAAWNAMKPVMSQAQTNLRTRGSIFLEGTGNNLKAGQIVLVIEDDEKKLRKIQKVITDDQKDLTEIIFEEVIQTVQMMSTVVTAQYTPYNNQNRVFYDDQAADILYNSNWNTADVMSFILTQGWSPYMVLTSLNNYETANLIAGVHVFRATTYPFGYNSTDQVTYNSDGAPNPISSWTPWPLKESIDAINLDTVYNDIVKDSYVAIQQDNQVFEDTNIQQVTAVETRPRTDYGMTVKTTELKITGNSNWWTGDNTDGIRGVTVHAQSEQLGIAKVPITTAISGDRITLSKLYLELHEGKAVVVTGERNDLNGVWNSEIRFINEVRVAQGLTQIIFKSDLDNTYKRETVTINANVALATHGASVQEILGNGDASQPFQKFVLKQVPLTYISAATPSGTASSLTIRVNGILWKEVPTLYGKAPNEKIYITRQSNAGDTTIIFGDGITGARLPSGQQNVVAYYRKGIGAPGLLKANQLSMLVDRPLNLKAVNNPIATTGAQDPEQLEDARVNANLTIFTLDRIVSLQDFEDFARAFAGISKAHATWVWQGRKRCVHITVAGIDGATETPNSELLEAITAASIPNVPVLIDTYQAKLFQLEGKIKVQEPEYIPDLVLAAVEERLRTTFSFAKRQFGQIVTLSEVITTIQNVEGVVFVDLDHLFISGNTPTTPPSKVLIANVASAGAEQTIPAELLTLDPRPLNLLNL